MQGSYLDEGNLRAALAGIDAAFQLAAREDLPFLPAGDSDGSLMFEANVLATDRLLQFASGLDLQKVVVVTACWTFGWASGTVTDGSRPAPIATLKSPYTTSRFQSEFVCLEHALRGVPVTTVAPSAVVGPGDTKLAAQLIRAFLAGRLPLVPSGGFNFVSIDDVVNCLIGAFEDSRPGERFLIVDQNLSYRHFLTRVAKLAGSSPPLAELPASLVRAGTELAKPILRALGHPLAIPAQGRFLNERFYFSPNSAVRRLGLPKASLDDALRATIKAVRS